MKKVRWGVLGTADIAVGKVIPAMQRGRLTEVVAIASRSPEKAREAAQRLGIARAHGSYEALLADPGVDAVYVPLRNDPARGGGALMDIGCYPISVARWLFGAEPGRVLGLVEYDPRFGVDRLASAVLDLGTGTAAFTCSTQLAPLQQVHVLGTGGRV